VTKPPVIQLENIVKDYGQLRALHKVTMTVGAGVTGLLGPNGAGKTTMIKVLLGLVRASSGRGNVLGYDLMTQPRKIRSVVGYMPEDDCYVAGLSGVEMVQFAARLSGQPVIEGLRRAHEILDFCGIEQERYRMVDTYSTGMRQKLKFAQAIVHDPALLILDEPTAGLDPEERQAMLNRIGILVRTTGKAVLLSTHILPDVQSCCNHVVIMARGTVRRMETLEVLSKPTSPALHLRTTTNPEALVRRIEQEGGEVWVRDDGSLVVDGRHQQVIQRLWQWADECGVTIRTLAPSRNSLEQVFLDAVRGDSRADS
jgi:ABC-2 type transport system ATP-binding protein